MKKQHGKNENFNQQSFAETIRQNTLFQARIIIMISVVSGIICIAAGSGFFIYIQNHLPSAEAKNIITPIAIFCIVGFIFIALASALFFSPKCPFCRKHFKIPHTQLANGFCPECRHILFLNKELSAIEFPTAPCSNVPLHFYFYAALSFVLVITAFALLIHICDNACYWRLFSAFIFFEGLTLALFPFYLMILQRLRRKYLPEIPACKICGEIPLKGILSLTGNCSNCGSPIAHDWPSPEPGPIADLPTWNEVRKYQNKMAVIFLISFIATFAIAIALFHCGAGIIETYGVFLMLAGILIIIPGIVSPILYMEHGAIKKRNKFMVFFRCPYCEFSLYPNSSALKNFERCPKCRRRLIKRSEADEN